MIEREINCTSASNRHLMEERGQVLLQEFDETGKYSDKIAKNN